MEQLSGTDSFFLYQEKGNNYNHIAALGIYDPSSAPGGKVRFKDILGHFRNRLDLHKLFRRVLVTVPHALDRPYWIDCSEIDIEYHVRHIALPHPGDWRQLMIQVARIHSRPLDRSRPLWEVYVIEGLDRIPGLPEGSFALFIKLHHASVDGHAAGQVLGTLHSSQADTPARELAEHLYSEREPNVLELYSRALPHLAERAISLSKFSLRMTERVVRKIADAAVAKLTNGAAGAALGDWHLPTLAKAPATRFNQLVSANRVLEAVNFPLPAMKAMCAQLPGATINDVLLTVVGGALRKYLTGKEELPDLSLTALMPVNRNADSGVGMRVNSLGGVAVSLHSAIADPLGRLAAICSDSNRSRHGLDTVGQELIASLMESVPHRIVDNVVRHALLPQFNTAVSNARGPDATWYIAGARLVQFYPVSIAANYVGLNHTGFSYNNVMWISMVACRNMMPDPAFYAECMRDSFAELAAAATQDKNASAQTKPKAKRRKATSPVAAVKVRQSRVKRTPVRSLPDIAAQASVEQTLASEH